MQTARWGAAQATPQQANSDGTVQEAAQAMPLQEQGDSLDVVLVVRSAAGLLHVPLPFGSRISCLARKCLSVFFAVCILARPLQLL